MAATRSAQIELGKRLKELRETAKLTGAELAARLGDGWTQPRVSKIEGGKQHISADEIRAWVAITGGDLDEMLLLLDRATTQYHSMQNVMASAGGAAQVQDDLALADAAAKRIVIYEPTQVISHCQTADYMWTLLHLPGGPLDFGRTEDELAHAIAARVRRQAIIFEPGRDITLLMGEAALHTIIGNPELMRGQLEHLARLAETLTTATIGVVPFSEAMPVAALGGWVIRDFAVRIETSTGNVDLADPTTVDRFDRYTGLLLEAAKTGASAAALIRRVAQAL